MDSLNVMLAIRLLQEEKRSFGASHCGPESLAMQQNSNLSACLKENRDPNDITVAHKGQAAN